MNYLGHDLIRSVKNPASSEYKFYDCLKCNGHFWLEDYWSKNNNIYYWSNTNPIYKNWEKTTLTCHEMIIKYIIE